MGQIVKYRCKSCGFESHDIYEGVGFGGDDTGEESLYRRHKERQEIAKMIQREEHEGKLMYEAPMIKYADDTDCTRKIYQELCELGICPKCRKQHTLIKHGVGLWD